MLQLHVLQSAAFKNESECSEMIGHLTKIADQVTHNPEQMYNYYDSKLLSVSFMQRHLQWAEESSTEPRPSSSQQNAIAVLPKCVLQARNRNKFAQT